MRCNLVTLLLPVMVVVMAAPCKMASVARAAPPSPVVFPKDENPVAINGTVKHTGRTGNSQHIVNGPALRPALNRSGVPACAVSGTETFCEDIEGYPEIQVNQALRNLSEWLKEAFLSSALLPRQPISQDDLGEERVCSPRPKTVFPKVARSTKNEWLYVPNDNEYAQPVTTEICVKEGKPCAYLDNNMPAGFHSKCKQRFAYKKLLALDPQEKKAYPETFNFPSCCACYVSYPTVFSRSGGAPR